MNQQERQAIEAECHRLQHAYCIHLDRREFDAFLGLFTPDARLSYPYADLSGDGEIRRWLDARAETVFNCHVMGSMLVEAAAADRATGISTVTVYRQEAGKPPFATPLAYAGQYQVGQYEDVFAFADGRWRIARRLVTVLLNVPV
jgi:hypothetical protein